VISKKRRKKVDDDRIVSDAIKNGLLINHVITFISFFTLTKKNERKKEKKNLDSYGLMI